MRTMAISYPRVTTVVLNWNRFNETEECIKSLERSGYPDLDIILVDNCSSDDSAIRLKERFAHYTFVQRTNNGGYAQGNNDGIRRALSQGAKYILVLNNDVTVQQGFLEPMSEILMTKPEVGIVTCKAYVQGRPSKTYCTGGYVSSWRCAGVPIKDSDKNRDQEVQFISGCVLLIRSEVFEMVGGFDERYFMYFEDLDFSNRVKEKFKLWYTPRGEVIHKSGAGQGWREYTPVYLYYSTRNRIWAFKNRWWMYRFYVVVYSFWNCLAKSIVLVMCRRHDEENRKMISRISSVWKGMFHGLFGKAEET